MAKEQTQRSECLKAIAELTIATSKQDYHGND